MANGQDHLVVGLLYRGALSLDLLGPMEAFNYATLELKSSGRAGYRLGLAAAKPGPVETLSGVKMVADFAFSDLGPVGTVIVPGQRTGDAAYREEGVVDFLRNRAGEIGRIASVCSGAIVCAEAGLLSGKRVTTHWMDSGILRAEHPDVVVDDDCIFIRDGNVYSSGGVTAGIDLALSIIEEDHGRPLALKVARRMIVYLKRQGGQSQFSDILGAQMCADRFAPLVDWIEERLAGKLDVEVIAEAANMSPRNFTRRFQEEFGMTPMRYVAARRLEFARALIEESDEALGLIAARSGFQSEERLRRAFHRALGVSPVAYRRRFGPAGG